MARRSNFDDTELQRSLAELRKEYPATGMKGLRDAASAFVELAKKRTKLASRPRIVRDYKKSGTGRRIEAAKGKKGAALEAAVEKELDSRIKAIGYQRNGWRITRVGKRVIEISNVAKNSRFVKNTVRAGRFAARETLKEIPHLLSRRLRKVAAKHSAKK